MAGTSDAGAAFAEGMGRRLDEGEAEAVRSWLARAPAGCPAARVALAEFAAHTGAKLAGAGEDLAHALGTLRPGDLYLAFAIARQDPGAIAELERRLGEVDVVLRAANLGELTDEIRQHMRVSLVLPRAAGPPVILDYAGRGDLGAWLRTIAACGRRGSSPSARVATPRTTRMPCFAPPRARRRRGIDRGLRSRATRPSSSRRSTTPWRRWRRASGRCSGRRSSTACQSINWVPGCTGVPPATAARWLAVARADLLEQTVKRLQARLGVGRADLDSLWRLVRSRLDISQL